MKTAELFSRLAAHAAEIGHSEFGCPKSNSNIDPLMHRYAVATNLSSFFKKQRERALADMLNAVSADKIDKAVSETITTKFKQTVPLLNGALYSLTLITKAPSMSLDVTGLTNRLKRDGRYTAKEVDALFADNTTPKQPAKSFEVTSIDG